MRRLVAHKPLGGKLKVCLNQGECAVFNYQGSPQRRAICLAGFNFDGPVHRITLGLGLLHHCPVLHACIPRKGRGNGQGGKLWELNGRLVQVEVAVGVGLKKMLPQGGYAFVGH